jgi:two-component system NarL family response regulator
MTAVEKTNPIRILIVDDHPIVCEGLAALINRRKDMTVVAEAHNGQEALELFQQHRPDVSLVDLRMPEVNGVTAIEQIRRRYPNAQMIVLTTYDGDEDIYRALRAGAQAYLLKDAPRQELLATIRAVHQGKTILAPALAEKLVSHTRSEDLSPREREVLQLMRKGRLNKEIGAALNITEGTVKLHVNSILAKLGVTNRTEAVNLALKRGILHVD